ncbi:hypothetical protein Tco_0347624 [Tanacetum coccineum]
MTQAAIKKLVVDSVSAALEAQATNMANTDNTTRSREAPVARKCSYKEFMSCQPINFKDSEKMMEVFIGGLPRSIERNVTASKPQTLEEAINIAQRLIDQVTKHTPMQVSSDHKQKFDDIRTFNNNNYLVSAGSSSSVPADYVRAGHVIISADRYSEYADLSYRRN